MAKFTAYQIKKWNHTKPYDPTKDADFVIGNIPQVQVPVRPVDYKGDKFLSRLKFAWGAFTGKYDVVEWREDNSLAVNDYTIQKTLREMKKRK